MLSRLPTIWSSSSVDPVSEDTALVEKGYWRAYLRKDAGRGFIKKLCKTFVSKHGFSVVPGNEWEDQWVAVDNAHQDNRCLMSLSFNVAHTILAIQYGDIEEISLWNRLGMVLAKYKLLRSIKDPLPSKAQRTQELKDSFLTIPEQNLQVAYLQHTAPIELALEIIRIISDAHEMKMVEANRNQTITRLGDRCTFQLRIGVNKRMQRILRVTHSVAWELWRSRDWEAAAEDFFLDLVVALQARGLLDAVVPSPLNSKTRKSRPRSKTRSLSIVAEREVDEHYGVKRDRSLSHSIPTRHASAPAIALRSGLGHSSTSIEPYGGITTATNNRSREPSSPYVSSASPARTPSKSPPAQSPTSSLELNPFSESLEDIDLVDEAL